MKKIIMIIISIMLCLIILVTAESSLIYIEDPLNEGVEIVYKVKQTKMIDTYHYETIIHERICTTLDSSNESDEIKCYGGNTYQKKVIDGQESKPSKIKRVGIRYENKIYNHANMQDGIIYKWGSDHGDRNFNEYGACLDYEIRKGVCTIKKIKK